MSTHSPAPHPLSRRLAPRHPWIEGSEFATLEKATSPRSLFCQNPSRLTGRLSSPRSRPSLKAVSPSPLAVACPFATDCPQRFWLSPCDLATVTDVGKVTDSVRRLPSPPTLS